MFKLILASAVTFAIAITLGQKELLAQTPPNETVFASIEVKPAHSTDPQNARLRVLPNGNLVGTSVSAIMLVSEGYEVPANPSDRLSGLAPWVYGERYDIEATAHPNAKH